MEAKLIKVLDQYHLYDGDKAIATTIVGNPMLLPNLSLKNCQAIERGYDLDELAKSECKNSSYNDLNHLVERGFKIGFQKALEILGDKEFSEEDMEKCFNAESNGWVRADFYIQSLQQTEWDVEIVTLMDCHNDNTYLSTDEEAKLCTNTGIHAFDSEGNLILKRK